VPCTRNFAVTNYCLLFASMPAPVLLPARVGRGQAAGAGVLIVRLGARESPAHIVDERLGAFLGHSANPSVEPAAQPSYPYKSMGIVSKADKGVQRRIGYKRPS